MNIVLFYLLLATPAASYWPDRPRQLGVGWGSSLQKSSLYTIPHKAVEVWGLEKVFKSS